MDRIELGQLIDGLDLYCTDNDWREYPGSEAYQRGRILRHHDASLPSMYFDGRGGRAYFTIRVDELHHLSPWLWEDLGMSTEPDYLRVCPKPGRGREALESVLQGR